MPHPARPNPNPDLQRLEQLWPSLTCLQRKCLLLAVLCRSVPRPLRFSLCASLALFALLPLLPLHPLAIPTAIGASLSIALIGEAHA